MHPKKSNDSLPHVPIQRSRALYVLTDSTGKFEIYCGDHSIALETVGEVDFLMSELRTVRKRLKEFGK